VGCITSDYYILCSFKKKEKTVASKTQTEKSPWQTLRSIEIADEHIETKGKFRYVSWAWAWHYIKNLYPDATYEKHLFGTDQHMLPYMRDDAGHTYVMVTVTIAGLNKTEVYPVTNHNNKSIQNPDSYDVNTALQRCLTKAIAMHGLGHYIYAGEDLPPDLDKPQSAEQTKAEETGKPVEVKSPIPAVKDPIVKDLDAWFTTVLTDLAACRDESDRKRLVASIATMKKELPEEMAAAVKEVLDKRKDELKPAA
tara:strand:+ start:1406 stop:2164 length:759 start_codon:yes stop_codon:yes gene_type:complete